MKKRVSNLSKPGQLTARLPDVEIVDNSIWTTVSEGFIDKLFNKWSSLIGYKSPDVICKSYQHHIISNIHHSTDSKVQQTVTLGW